ncbi:hypothetical protein [Pseudomonas sp. B22129]|uniref:hypothetical protein n=1 Tax=Pseudomonas sp. B22129 TaxID=3235111 RepID=UPI00378518F7
MSDSNQSSRDVSCCVNAVACDHCPDDCDDGGADVHVHVHVHHHHHCCRPASAKPAVVPEKKPKVLPTINIGYAGATLGSPAYSKVLPLIGSPSNYGANGIYNKVAAIKFTDASADVIGSSLTALQLRTKYPMLSIGLFASAFNLTEALRFREYVKAGGVMWITSDQAASPGATNVLTQFGHTGSFARTIAAPYSGVSSATEASSNYFGASTGVPLSGNAKFVIAASQLPPGSRVLATSGPEPIVWLPGGTGECVAWTADAELVNSNTDGTTVDGPQEIFFQNLFAFLIDKVLLNTQ